MTTALSRMTASAARRRSGARCVCRCAARRRRPRRTSAPVTQRRVGRRRLDSRRRPGRARRAGRRRDGVGARRHDGHSRSPIASGRFELRTLSPGPYLVRAHLERLRRLARRRWSRSGRARARRRRSRCDTRSVASPATRRRAGARRGRRRCRRRAPVARPIRATTAPTAAASTDDDHSETRLAAAPPAPRHPEGRDVPDELLGGRGRRRRIRSAPVDLRPARRIAGARSRRTSSPARRSPARSTC